MMLRRLTHRIRRVEFLASGISLDEQLGPEWSLRMRGAFVLERLFHQLCKNNSGRGKARCSRGVLATLLAIIFYAGGISRLEAQVTSGIGGTVADQQGLPIVGAEVFVRADAIGAETKTITDSDGNFGAVGLQPGTYTVTASHEGFTTKVYSNVNLSVNAQIRMEITLVVGSMQQTITVGASPPVLETGNSSTGSTILPSQVESMPLNGRNYLDLLQLVPGVTLNRNFKEGDDNSSPILGERANNAYVLIDGMPNRDEVDGGPAGQFNQDSILEFQVLTSSYKAEFGRGSGGIVNVATKSGTKDWHGSASLFHRNYLLDTPDVSNTSVPFLLRWDTSATTGGPLVRDRVFFFGAAERIRETRQTNFQYPADFPLSLKQ